ncbi:MAG: hypothetical protein Q9192_000459 [Flavoplaca navasiana]
MEAYANTPKEVLETIDYLDQLKHQVVQPANDDNECSICLEPFSTSGQGQRNQTADVGETPVSLPCGHVFGFTCIERYLSPFGEARNSCPICRRKLFDAPYKPDTVTKLRARLEAFDKYYQRHPENAHPHQTARLRDRLWQFSRSRGIVRNELEGAIIEAQAAIVYLTAAGIRPQNTTAQEAAHQHRQLRAQMLRLRQQAYYLQREQEANAAREQRIASERLQLDRARDSQPAGFWQELQESAARTSQSARDQQAQRHEQLLNEARPDARLIGNTYMPFDSGDSSDDEVAPLTRDLREPRRSARIARLSQGVQRGQRPAQLPHEAEQQTPPMGGNSDEDDEAHFYPPYGGSWRPRHSALNRRFDPGIRRAGRLPTEVTQPAPETSRQRTAPANVSNQRPMSYLATGMALSRQQQTTTTPAERQQNVVNRRVSASLGPILDPYSTYPQRNATLATTAPERPNAVLDVRSLQEAREQRLDTMKRTLDQREEALNRRNEALEARERSLAHRESMMTARERIHGLQARTRIYNDLTDVD